MPVCRLNFNNHCLQDLLEAEKSINMPNARGVPMPLEFWAGTHNTSSPKEYQGAPGQPRQEGGSPTNPNKDGPGENLSRSYLVWLELVMRHSTSINCWASFFH